MYDNSDIIISKESLDEILKLAGSTLVGKVLRRFEITNDLKTIKASTKELIYEEFRTIKRWISAHSEGREVEIFKISKGVK